MLSPRVLLSLFLMLAFMACQKTSFKGANNSRGNQVPVKPPLDLSDEYQKDHPDEDIANNPDAPKPGKGINPDTGVVPGNGKNPFNIEHTFFIPCTDAGETRVAFEKSADLRYKAVVKGEICPESTANMHLVFVVDFSGSMGPHYDEKRGVESPGTDPLTNGTCGRLEAAKTMIDYVINNRMQNGDNVSVSLVPFANIAVEKMVIENEKIKDFKDRYLNKKYFCRYAAQKDHERLGESLNIVDLGLSKGDLTPHTNYEAGFDRAHALLTKHASTSNNTELFFISDGQPTISNADVSATKADENVVADEAKAIKGGEKAGLALRNDPAFKHLTINGLYLGIEGTPAYDAAAGVLAKVTGSPDRVIAAKNAKGLADKILTFPRAQINVNAADYPKMATLSIYPDPIPYGETQLGIQYLKEVRAGVWEYQTQPFNLLGIKGQKIDNRVLLNIFSPDGFKFNSLLHIDYTQK